MREDNRERDRMTRRRGEEIRPNNEATWRLSDLAKRRKVEYILRYEI